MEEIEKSTEIKKLEDELKISKLKNQITGENRNTFKNSITSKSLVGIFGITTFVSITFVSLQFFAIYEIDKILSPIFSLIAGAFATYIILMASGIVKEFTIKGGTMEVSAKLQEEIKNVQNDVKETKKDFSNKYDNLLQQVNLRIDNAITNSNSNVNQINLGDIVESLVTLVREEKIEKLHNAGINKNVESIKTLHTSKKLSRDYNRWNTQEEKLNKILEKIARAPSVSSDEESMLIEANYLFSQKNYKKSMKILNTVLIKNPKNSSAWNNKGVISAQLGNDTEALRCFDEATKLDPSPTNYRNKGGVLRKLERYDEALTCLDEAIRLRQDYDFAWLTKGIVLEEVKRFNEANECFEHVLDIARNDAFGLDLKGYAFWRLGNDTEALRCFDEGLKLNPNEEIILYDLSQFYASKNNVDESVKYLAKALVIDPTMKNRIQKSKYFDSIRHDIKFVRLTSSEKS